MISIKKVEVTPIDRNYASVVDSTATQDDKTKNTYSMRVIDSQLDTKADSADLDDYYTKTEIDTNLYDKDDFVTIYGKTSVEENSEGQATFEYPTGFTKENCTIISVMARGTGENESWGIGSTFDSGNIIRGTVPISVSMNDQNIYIIVTNIVMTNGSSPTVVVPSQQFDIKITLMKIDPDVSAYEQGDVNMDGSINSTDLQMIQDYIMNNITLTDKQFKLADMNGDGRVSPADYTILYNLINS